MMNHLIRYLGRHKSVAIFLFAVLCAVSLVLFFLSNSDVQIDFTNEEAQWKQENPEPVLGVLFHYPPYEILNLDDLYLGLVADYVRLLEDYTGLRFKLVRCANAREAARMLSTQAVDALATVTPDSKLSNSPLLTKPYIRVPAAIIARKELEGDLTLDLLRNMKVGSVLSDSFTGYIVKRYPDGPPFEFVHPQGGYIGGLRALSMGDYDVLLCDMAVASHYIATSGISNLRIAGMTGYEVPYSMAVQHDKPHLASILNKALDNIATKDKLTIKERWIGLHAIPWWETGTFRFWGLLTLSVIVILFCLILMWTYSLRAQVEYRTSQLRSINRVLIHSLSCRSEKEVMLCCQKEAVELFNSVLAVWGHLNGTVFIPEMQQPEEIDVSISLSPEQCIALKEHSTIASNEAFAHILLLPLHKNDEEAFPCVALMRHSHPYSRQETAQLREWLFIVSEVVLRRRAERELNEKREQLQHAQKMEAIGAFAAGISHDFNNILTTIIANGEMLEPFHSNSPAAAKKGAGILAAAYRGRDLIQRILHFARREDERKIWLRPSDIIKETIGILEPSVPDGMSISFTGVHDEPFVLANRTQLHQILMNLGINAIQAMGETGSLHIYLKLHSKAEMLAQLYTSGISHLDDDSLLYVHSNMLDYSPNGYISLNVSDDGAGIEESVLLSMFSPFFTTKSSGQGTGLGLAMVDSIVKSHRGKLLVVSTSKGSTFRVYLPLSAGNSTSPVLLKKMCLPTTDHLSDISEGGSVLIVDDDKELLEACTLFLKSMNITAKTASSASHGMKLFDRNPNQFAMVITDYSMPDMNGDEVVAHIRRHSQAIPIVMITGDMGGLDIPMLDKFRIQAILEKPLDLRRLAELLL